MRHDIHARVRKAKSDIVNAAAKKEVEQFIESAQYERTRLALSWALTRLDGYTRDKPRCRNVEAEKIRWARKQTEVQTLNEAIKSRAGNKHQRWTDSHDLEVMNSSMRDADIAKKIGRSLLAVKARRAKLKAGAIK